MPHVGEGNGDEVNDGNSCMEGGRKAPHITLIVMHNTQEKDGKGCHETQNKREGKESPHKIQENKKEMCSTDGT